MKSSRSPMVHVELHTSDLPRARALYAELCGWPDQQITTGSGAYLALELSGSIGGGIVACGTRSARWLPYVEVADVHEKVERARELGASVLLAPREGPTGWRGVVVTQEGGEIAFWQPKDPG